MNMKKVVLAIKFRLTIAVIGLTIVLSGCDECRNTKEMGSLHYYNTKITSNSSLKYDLEQLEYLTYGSSTTYDSLGFVMSLLPSFDVNGGIDGYVNFDPELECFNRQLFTKIEIWSDKDYDETHHAGDNLIEIFSVIPNGETTAISIKEFILRDDNSNESVFVLNSPPQFDGIYDFVFFIILEDGIGRMANFSSITINK